jgi:hypothetical protein
MVLYAVGRISQSSKTDTPLFPARAQLTEEAEFGLA